MRETEKAYLAGLVDGEGHIAVTKNRPSARPGDVYFQPRLEITMTHEETIRWAARMMGSPRVTRINPRQPHHLVQWRVQLSGRRVAEVLQDISPYMVTKRARAEAIIRFVSTVRRGDRWAPLSDTEAMQREQLWQETRGVA